MNLLMVTNTFLPFVGGLVRSVEAFSAEFRRRGHRVLIVAPSFHGVPKRESGVIRLPAIRRFHGSDFSFGLPLPGFLFPALEAFRPDIIHSHHPFLLGDMALRLSASRNAPLIFTHHTMYEMLAGYVLSDSPAIRRFVVELSTGYANLCDRVIAPSASTAEILQERGVRTRIEVIPTGVDAKRFREGDRAGFRASMGIPPGDFVVGYVGRLVPEKNVGFLVEAVASFLSVRENARFLIVGSGPSAADIRKRLDRWGLSGRVHIVGTLEGQELADSYHAMDVFAFASQSETQGMVISEAMAAGKPVVAVDAPGVRDAVVDGRNGFLLPSMALADFREALSRMAGLSPAELRAFENAARETAERSSIQMCAGRALRLYESVLADGKRSPCASCNLWSCAWRVFGRERLLWKSRAHAAVVAFSGPGRHEEIGLSAH